MTDEQRTAAQQTPSIVPQTGVAPLPQGDRATGADTAEDCASPSSTIAQSAVSAAPAPLTDAEVTETLQSVIAMVTELLEGEDAAKAAARICKVFARAKSANEMGGKVETLIMQAAACMTATFQNTRESIKERIGKDNPYWSQAYADVCASVDREIRERERAEKAEAAAREQALASENKALEDAAKLCDCTDTAPSEVLGGEDGIELCTYLAAAIRALKKEPK